MKKTEYVRNGVRVVESCGNVFLDLGFDQAEAQVLTLRVELMAAIERHIEAKGWTQAEAAKHMGITQPRVSKLLKRKWDDFSMDMLVTLAGRLGIRYELKLAA